MTDNEIIKSMQCVIGNNINCSECTYQKVLPFPSCRMMCAKNALNLINRQKAKIEALQMDNKQLQSDVINANQNWDHIKGLWECEKEKVESAKQKVICACKMLKTAKSEAIKEFADRLKEKLQWDVEFDNKLVFESDIDNLVKEMTEV